MCQVLGQRSIRVIIKLNNLNYSVIYTIIASNIYYNNIINYTFILLRIQ